MKTILCLMLACAAGLQAANYTSDWAAFDAGGGPSRQTGLEHRGLVSDWFAQPLRSAHYTAQAGPPSTPPAEPAPGTPRLTIARAADHLRISWPLSAGTFVLEEKSALNQRSWVIVPGPYQTDRSGQFILVPSSEPSRFFRLTPRQ